MGWREGGWASRVNDTSDLQQFPMACYDNLAFISDCGNLPQVVWTIIRAKKKHDSQRRDRILRFLLRPEIGQFSPHFGAISFLCYTINLESGENSKNPVETAPRNC